MECKMATEVAAKTCRIIAFNAATQRQNHMRVVNIVSTTPAAGDKPNRKQHTQASVAPRAGEYPTYMDSGGTVSGLPTIFISGYSGPS